VLVTGAHGSIGAWVVRELLPFPGRVDSFSLLEVVGAVEETPLDQATGWPDQGDVTTR
jgi:thioester reductase-like protein